MFLKSLQWRLVSIFCLIAFCLVVPISLYLNNRIEDKYYEDFEERIARGFETWSFPTAQPDAESLKAYMKENAFLFTANEDYRSYTIATKTGEVIDSNDKLINENPEEAVYQLLQSENFVQAMTGVERNKKNLESVDNNGFFDFARPVGDYILYFRYYEEDWSDMMNDINRSIFTSLFISLGISLIVGYLLSKTITSPIGSLMTKARSIASGDFDQLLEVKSNDEISKLTETFNHMATSLKKYLTEISSEKNKLETILNYLTDGVIAFNLKGEVIHANPASKKFFGGEEKCFDDYVRKLKMEYSINDVLYLNSTSTKEYILNVGDNFIKVYFAVFTGEHEKPEGVIAVIHDITAQQRLDNMRKDFVANVSHELRTPLTSIKSYTEALLDGALEDKTTSEKFLSVINLETDRMIRLVRELLELSKIDNQQTKWRFEEVPFAVLVKDVAERMGMEAASKRQTIKCYELGDVPSIEADYGKLEQVISNLLSNAIKYTPEEGSITVYIGRSHNEVYAKISDTGIGIPEADLNRIFERFYRVDKARSREMGGTGLGLSIAKEITEAHYGSISITSQVGKGTEVTVRYPIAQPKVASAEK
jgi:two-component system sensor histidine kinase VicK